MQGLLSLDTLQQALCVAPALQACELMITTAYFAGFMSPTMMSPLLGGVQFSPGPDLNKGSRSPGFAPMSPGFNPQSPGEGGVRVCLVGAVVSSVKCVSRQPLSECSGCLLA